MQTLVKEGVNPNVNDKDGRNAFFFDCQGMRNHSNSLELYKYLESLGIEPNYTLKNGLTPLHSLAYKNKDNNVFNYFIKKGIDVNQQDKDGNTAFLNATNNNNIDIIELLFGYVDNVNQSNKKEHTALMKVVNNNNTSNVVKFLLNNGADPFSKDIYDNNIAFYILDSY